jgi:hypothetical protein
MGHLWVELWWHARRCQAGIELHVRRGGASLWLHSSLWDWRARHLTQLGRSSLHLVLRVRRRAWAIALRRHGTLESLSAHTTLVLRASHVILLLPGHEESFFVLLLQQHELHLVVLESVVALGCAWGVGGHARSWTVAGKDLMLAVEA